MVNRVFYSDKILCSYEQIQRWYEIIDYIESLYLEHRWTPLAEEIICLGIFEAWYAITYLPDSSVRYIIFSDFDYYESMWKHFVCEGLDHFYNSPSVCWIMGYTMKTCNESFPHFKHFGEDLIKRALSLSNEHMPFDVLSGKKRKTKNDEYYIVAKELFPSNSIADKFFKEMLSDAGIDV